MTVKRGRLIKGLKIWTDILFFLVLAASALVLIFWPVSRITEGVWEDMGFPVEIDDESGSLPAGTLSEALGLPPSFHLVEAKGELRVTAPGMAQGLVYWLVTAISALVVLLGLHLLRRILATTAESRPFHHANVRRLNLLGWLLVATGIAGPLSQSLYTRWVMSAYPILDDAPLHAPLTVDGSWILGGLLLLVLASVWGEAARMAEEQSLTV